MLRSVAAIAAAIAGVALAAGAIRLLPLAFAEHVPVRLLWPLSRGAFAVALEVALFLALPIGTALACSGLVARGEALALQAVGVSPARLLSTAWLPALALALACSAASFAWGREATAPGRLATSLVSGAREACVDASGRGPGPGMAEVPFVGLTWVCHPGVEPVAVGGPTLGRGLAGVSARSFTMAPDLRALELEGVTLLLGAADRDGGVRVRVGSASIRGIRPPLRASTVSPPLRAGTLALTSLALAVALGFEILRGKLGSRPGATAVAVVSAAAALLVFGELESGRASPAAFAGLPLSAVALALVSLRALGWWRDARAGSIARPGSPRPRPTLLGTEGGGTDG